ncbi:MULTISPECIES: hypothetical protein [Helicobacter]|uniref:hypothetical protein n=2 Tax=Helicobacteraceae TaxID=72293 RepID=UPI002613BC07|nr:hypothetical protein [Helicobacter sp. UBA3407]
MKYYIYGKGVNGKSVSTFLEIYYPHCVYSFIDDSKEESSLENLQKQIKQEDKILVVSTLYYDKMIHNLNQYHLKNYENGILWCGEVINNKIKYIKKPHKKYIGFVIEQFTQKHFGNLAQQLKDLGYEIIYFVDNFKMYEKYSKIGSCFLASNAILSQINTVDMMLLTNITATHKEVISIDLTHGFQGATCYPFLEYTKAERDFMKYVFSTTDYIVCGSKKNHQDYEVFLSNIQENSRLLDVGYIKLDTDVEVYNDLVKSKCGAESQNNIVIFAFTFFNDIKRIVALMEQCISMDLRVFFKPHSLYNKAIVDEIRIALSRECRDYFVEDIDYLEICYHSLCLISECSSMGYTYPLTSCKPSICLDVGIRSDMEIMTKGCGEYYDERLMFMCQNDKDLSSILREIKQMGTAHYASVLDYQKTECFNFGNATRSLIEKIQTILGDKK